MRFELQVLIRIDRFELVEAITGHEVRMKQLHKLPGCFLALFSLLSLLALHSSSAQQVPPVACPQYFAYLGYNQEYVGQISVRHDPQFQENTVRVEFSQRGTLDSVSQNFSMGEKLLMLITALRQ